MSCVSAIHEPLPSLVSAELLGPRLSHTHRALLSERGSRLVTGCCRTVRRLAPGLTRPPHSTPSPSRLLPVLCSSSSGRDGGQSNFYQPPRRKCCKRGLHGGNVVNVDYMAVIRPSYACHAAVDPVIMPAATLQSYRYGKSILKALTL